MSHVHHQEVIEKELKAICDRLPGTLGQTCEAYIPLIIQTLINKIEPEKVCTMIGLCSNSSYGDYLYLNFFLCCFSHSL